MAGNVVPLHGEKTTHEFVRNYREYLSVGVECSISPAFSNNDRRPRTQLCFQDANKRNLYTRTIDGTCEIGNNNEIIIHDVHGKRVDLIDIFPNISSWIISESPVTNLTDETTAQAYNLVTQVCQTA